jgi:hypothetical protein
MPSQFAWKSTKIFCIQALWALSPSNNSRINFRRSGSERERIRFAIQVEKHKGTAYLYFDKARVTRNNHLIKLNHNKTRAITIKYCTKEINLELVEVAVS